MLFNSGRKSEIYHLLSPRTQFDYCHIQSIEILGRQEFYTRNIHASNPAQSKQYWIGDSVICYVPIFARIALLVTGKRCRKQEELMRLSQTSDRPGEGYKGRINDLQTSIIAK
jgi:hypothetical protein